MSRFFYVTLNNTLLAAALLVEAASRGLLILPPTSERIAKLILWSALSLCRYFIMIMHGWMRVGMGWQGICDGKWGGGKERVWRTAGCKIIIHTEYLHS